jgi:hypothetical protein
LLTNAVGCPPTEPKAMSCWSECVVFGQPFCGSVVLGVQHGKRKFQYGPVVRQVAPPLNDS